MALHYIAEDLENHTWYVDLFVQTICDVETFAARWGELEELVAADDPTDA